MRAELPGTATFAATTQFVTRDDVAASIPCGPDVEPIADAARAYRDAGFTDVALCQTGDAGSGASSASSPTRCYPPARRRCPDRRRYGRNAPVRPYAPVRHVVG